MSTPFPALITLWEERTGVAMAPNLAEKNRRSMDAFTAALTQRLGIEGATDDQVEAKIARWEALEEACVQGGPQMVEVMRALRAEVAGNRCGKGAAAQAPTRPHEPDHCDGCRRCLDFTPRTPGAARYCTECFMAGKAEPPRDAALVAAECGCGGPAGHVPNGVWCRRGL